MKRFLMALTLTCAVALSANAGDISTSGSPAPPPPGTVHTDAVTLGDIASVPGDIPSGGIAQVASEGLLDLVGALSSLAF